MLGLALTKRYVPHVLQSAVRELRISLRCRGLARGQAALFRQTAQLLCHLRLEDMFSSEEKHFSLIRPLEITPTWRGVLGSTLLK